MKKHHHYEYEKHHFHEKIQFILTSLSFMLLDLLNLIVYAGNLVELTCSSFYNSIEKNWHDDPDEICDTSLKPIVCYYKLTPVFCAAYALPVLLYVLVAKPHDCFHCLSVQPGCRLSNFQYSERD